MKKSNIPNLAVLIIIIALTVAGCAKQLSSASKGENNLEYEFTGSESYSYMQTSDVIQSIVFGGQDVNTSIKTKAGFTAEAKGISQGDLILEITVDTLLISLNSMGTSMNEDISDVRGKSFLMTMSKKGKDLNLDEAENISYSIAGLQTSNLKASFITIFPTLPEGNISVGHTWQDTDTITVNTETENSEMILSTDYTVEAREKVSGYDCFRISYMSSGTNDGSSQTPQGLVVSNADVDIRGYYYFAIKEGVIISDHSEMKSDGDLSLPSGESIPMYTTVSTDLKLL
ncbi:MAG: hypothetical protein ACQETA_03180 [Bacteroidota bacterium]